MAVPVKKKKLYQKISPYFEIALAYLQFVGLIYQINLPWPSVWATFLQWASISTLASEFNLTGKSTHAVLDSRAHFLVLTVALPLVLSFVMLIFAKPVLVIMWFFVLLFSVGLLAAGIALLLLGIAGNGQTFAIAGSVGLFVCGLIFVLRWFARRRSWRAKTEAIKQTLREQRANAAAAALAVAALHTVETVTQIAVLEMADRESSSDSSSEEHVSSLELIELPASPEPTRNNNNRNSGSLKPLISPAMKTFLPPPLQQRPESRSITHRKFDQDKVEESEAFEDIGNYKDKQTASKGIKYIFTRFLIATLLILAGILTLGYFNAFPNTTVTPTFYSLRNIFGPIFIVLGVFVFVYLVVNCTKSGRVKVEAFKAFLEGRFIWLMLFCLTLLYIPFTTTALGAVRCVQLDCASGFQPPVARKLALDNAYAAPVYSTLVSSCVECSFANNCSIAASLCMPTTAHRLAMDLSQDCSSNLPWIIPITVLTGLVITIGTPYLFYKLVGKHTRMLENIPASGSSREQWEQRCNTTRNSAKMLYNGFTYNWRYYRMLLILQRLLLSVTTIFLFQEPVVLIYFTLVVHSLFFLFNLFIRPYRNLGVDGIAFGVGGGLVATCSFGVALSIKGAMPLAVAIFIIIIDLGFPISTTSFMMYLQEKRLKRQVAPQVEQGKPTPGQEKSAELKESGGEQEKPLDVVDILINSFTLKTMSNFFMLAGLVAFLGLAIGIVGILKSNSELNIVGPSLDTTTTAQDQFAGYTSWDEFTHNCCCLSSGDNSVETWKCVNGFFKERLRISMDNSGLSLRGFCNDTFASSVCSIPSSANNFQAGMCSGSSANDYTTKYLW